VKIQRKYIIAVYFGLLMGVTAYGASAEDRREYYAARLSEMSGEKYIEAEPYITSLPADTNLNAPGALGKYHKDRFPLSAEMPPLHACLQDRDTQKEILGALLSVGRPDPARMYDGIDVDIMHEGVTPLYEALTMKFFDPMDKFRYKSAWLLVSFGASLFSSCGALVTDRFINKRNDEQPIYVSPYFADYRFGDDRPTSTPFELALQNFMYTTKTRLEDTKYNLMPGEYKESAQVLSKILQRGFALCSFERLGDGSALREHEIVWRDADMSPHSHVICYKISQPVDLPALAITKRAYEMIMGASA
jgi:hypothetical protein